MSYYRIIATPRGPLATRLISGTLWGHLAWAVRYLEGKDALQRWLEEQEKKPWLVSSYMPKDMLPKPQLPADAPKGKGDLLELFELRKNIRKLNFIPEETFIMLRNGMSEASLAGMLADINSAEKESDWGVSRVRLAHNRIDRRTGRTPDEGGLYFEDADMHPSGSKIQIFMQFPSSSLNQVCMLLKHIGDNGFGANASIGCGSLSFQMQEEKILFGAKGTRGMSLSHGTCSANMADVRYRQHVHFGKMGGHFATGVHSPFKYPILMMQPGATFSPTGDGPYGDLLKGVHHSPDFTAVRHNALHLPIFFTEAAS